MHENEAARAKGAKDAKEGSDGRGRAPPRLASMAALAREYFDGRKTMGACPDAKCIPRRRDRRWATAIAPFGEVLFRDWGSVEALADDPCHFGIGVEPCDEFVSLLAVGDAIVEFVPDFSREVCDFAVSCFHIFTCLVCCW